MGSTIIKYSFLFFVLSIAKFGNTQNIFNKAFDVNNAPNLSSNVVETQNGYIFTQRADYNGFSHIQAFKIDSLGNFVDSNSIVQSTNALFYGSAGSLQKLSTNEYCQLYKIGADSILRLVFFNENLIIIRTKNISFGYSSYPSLIKQINDSTLLTLGKVKLNSTYDLVLINTDLQGNERWRTIFGTSGKNDNGFAIELINNFIIIGGQTDINGISGTPHIFKINDTGSVVLDTIYTSLNNGNSLSYHPNFGLYLTGTNTNSALSHPFLVSLNPNLTINWALNYFIDHNIGVTQMVISNIGVLTIIGGELINQKYIGFFFQTNSVGDSLGSKLIEHLPNKLAAFNDIRPTSDGGYIMAGQTRAPTQDSWIVKVNSWGCDNIQCIVSVAEVPKDESGFLSCYPNPSKGLGTVKGSFKTHNSNNKIKVFNCLGQLVFSITIATKEFELEVNLPSNGLYLVVIYQNNVPITHQKWVVQ